MDNQPSPLPPVVLIPSYYGPSLPATNNLWLNLPFGQCDGHLHVLHLPVPGEYNRHFRQLIAGIWQDSSGIMAEEKKSSQWTGLA